MVGNQLNKKITTKLYLSCFNVDNLFFYVLLLKKNGVK